MSLEFSSPNSPMAAQLFSLYADRSRCFFITPTQLGNASIDGKASQKQTDEEDFKVTFSPRGSYGGEPQCTFHLQLTHRDDVMALEGLFSTLIYFNERVISGEAVVQHLDPVARGKNFEFSSTAFSRPSKLGEATARTYISHLNISLLINDRPHYLGAITLDAGMKTVHNLGHDLAVLKALLLGEPESAIRAIGEPALPSVATA